MKPYGDHGKDVVTVPPDLAGPPVGEVQVPDMLRRTLETHSFSMEAVEPVWRNEAGGLTFAVAGTQGRAAVYAKCNPGSSGESLEDEAGRMTWLRQRHPAPEVLDLVTGGKWRSPAYQGAAG